jgi:hypothetical protein
MERLSHVALAVFPDQLVHAIVARMLVDLERLGPDPAGREDGVPEGRVELSQISDEAEVAARVVVVRVARECEGGRPGVLIE